MGIPHTLWTYGERDILYLPDLKLTLDLVDVLSSLNIGIYFALESPWWLVRKGRIGQAKKSLL